MTVLENPIKYDLCFVQNAITLTFQIKFNVIEFILK